MVRDKRRPSMSGECGPNASEQSDETPSKAETAIHCLPHHSPRVRANPQKTKETPTEHVGLWIPGGDEEDRTPDLRIANAALSQLSYVPINLGL